MHFSHYPFDVQECTFRLGSFSSTKEKIMFVGIFRYSQENQRYLPFQVNKKCVFLKIIFEILS